MTINKWFPRIFHEQKCYWNCALYQIHSIKLELSISTQTYLLALYTLYIVPNVWKKVFTLYLRSIQNSIFITLPDEMILILVILNFKLYDFLEFYYPSHSIIRDLCFLREITSKIKFPQERNCVNLIRFLFIIRNIW